MPLVVDREGEQVDPAPDDGHGNRRRIKSSGMAGRLNMGLEIALRIPNAVFGTMIVFMSLYVNSHTVQSRNPAALRNLVLRIFFDMMYVNILLGSLALQMG